MGLLARGPAFERVQAGRKTGLRPGLATRRPWNSAANFGDRTRARRRAAEVSLAGQALLARMPSGGEIGRIGPAVSKREEMARDTRQFAASGTNRYSGTTPF